MDLTPQKYLSMIVCEIDNIPPHSVPVVIREIMNEQENDKDVLESESSSSEDELSIGSSEKFDETELVDIKELQKQKRMQANLRNRTVEMEAVHEESD